MAHLKTDLFSNLGNSFDLFGKNLGSLNLGVCARKLADGYSFDGKMIKCGCNTL